MKRIVGFDENFSLSIVATARRLVLIDYGRVQVMNSGDNWLYAKRLLWYTARLFFYRPTPVFMHSWRNKILRLFGANIARRAYPYPDVKIWAPWNLVLEEGSCLGPGVDCYNVATVKLGKGVVVSQRSFLCTASHDFDRPGFLLTAGEINIESKAWVAAEAFVGPGVTIGKEAVVLARTVVVRDVPEGAVIGGNPGRDIRKRIIHN